ncbi:pilus assembly protein N-terminal domain-containing protein [Stieleria varia]|uniref:Pilus formation protein N-terminal domain-containing protein n=1 Tax=Stieleria varia TaxID=2528005 RepID=A0A5C6AM37_9BACT|nr:pilus assembly protein N-terminal domain-containing protein [Stieleria varia]TWU01075.1 hypothetical protein Pla52n_44460 [Stieleria varia]
MRDCNAKQQRVHRGRRSRTSKRAVLFAWLLAAASPVAAQQPQTRSIAPPVTRSPMRIVTHREVPQAASGDVQSNPFVTTPRSDRYPVQLASGDSKTSIRLKPQGNTSTLMPIHSSASALPVQPSQPSIQISESLPPSQPVTNPLVDQAVPLIASESFQPTDLIGSGGSQAIDRSQTLEFGNPIPSPVRAEAETDLANQEFVLPVVEPSDNEGDLTGNAFERKQSLARQNDDAGGAAMLTPMASPAEAAALQTVRPVADARDGREPIQETQPIFFTFSDKESEATPASDVETTAEDAESAIEDQHSESIDATMSEDADLVSSPQASLGFVQPAEPVDFAFNDASQNATGAPATSASDPMSMPEPITLEDQTRRLVIQAEDEDEVALSASDIERATPLTARSSPVAIAPSMDFSDEQAADSAEDMLAASDPVSLKAAPQFDSSQPDGLIVATRPMVLLADPPATPSILYKSESPENAPPKLQPGVIRENEKVVAAQQARNRPPVAVTTPPISVQSSDNSIAMVAPVIDVTGANPVQRQQQDATVVFEAPGADFETFTPMSDGRSLPDLLAAESKSLPTLPPATQSNTPSQSVPASPASFRAQPSPPAVEAVTTLNMSRTQVRSLTIGGQLRRVTVADKDVCQVIASGPNQLKLIGTGNGSTKLVVWADTEAGGPTRVKTFEIQVQDAVESTGGSLGNKTQLLNQTISRMFPSAKIRVTQNEDHLLVSGRCPDEVTAKQIVRMVRKTCLVPVRDSLTFP